MTDIINIIHLEGEGKYSEQRKQSFMEQMAEQKAPYNVWQGIKIEGLPFAGISKSHKQIIRDARERKLERVTIMEDDCVFSAPGAWDYYLSQLPKEADIFFGMIYEGQINENNKIVTGLSGLTIYTVYQRFYDVFLQMPEMNNLDRVIGLQAYKFDYYVCNPFVAIQSDGYSYNKRKSATYGHLLECKKMFLGKPNL